MMVETTGGDSWGEMMCVWVCVWHPEDDGPCTCFLPEGNRPLVIVPFATDPTCMD